MKRLLINNAAIFAFGWGVVIFILCATPGRYIPVVSWLELLSFDKFVHAFIFCLLCCFLLIIAIKKEQSWVIIFFYLLLAVVYGALLELMQAWYFSGRNANGYDIIANTMGCLLSLFFYGPLKKQCQTVSQFGL